MVGTLDKAGPGCRLYTPGRRLGVAWLRFTCGCCEFCRGGHENLCEHQRFTGYHEDGGYAEYALVPEAYAYPIPDGLEDLDAAPLLCSGIVGYRALKRCNLPPRGRLALFGFGSSAHLVAQIALHRGAEVFVVTRGEHRRRLAREIGAAWVGDTVSALPARVDSAIVFAPSGAVVPQALSALKRGGTAAIAGIHMTDLPAMAYEKTLFYERDLRSVTANTREDGRELLGEAAAIPVRPTVTVYPLEEANRALVDLANDRLTGTAVLRICS
jgi:propanol-preferring alcohol dehydrogenase